MTRKLKYSVAVLLIFWICISCSDGGSDFESDGDAERDSGDIDALIADGKDHLTRAEYSAAAEDFDAALKIDAESVEAAFGRSLAYIQELNAYFDNVLRMLESLGSGGSESADGDAELQAKLLAQYFVIADLRENGLLQLERLRKLKDVGNEFEFRLERFPLILNGKTVLDLHSEWDKADVYMLSGITYFLTAIMDLLISQRVDDALSRLSVIGNTVKSGDDIYTALARILDKFDFLLALNKYRGADLWSEAFVFAAAGADDIREAMSLMNAEKDEQDDDVCVQNSSLNTRKVRHFAIQGTFPLKPQTRRVPLLWEGEKLSLKGTLERLSTHLKQEPELRLRFDEDVITIVGILLDFVRKAIGIEELLGMFGLELDRKTLDLINNIGDSNGEEFPQMLISLLPLFGIPSDMLQLDLNAFASRPIGLRELLPNRGIDPLSGDPVLLMSFECARIGFAEKDFTPGRDALLLVSDPSPSANSKAGAGNDVVGILVKSGVVSEEGKFTVSDEENLSAEEHPQIETLFQVAIPNRTADEGKKSDGILNLPENGELRAYYTDNAAAEEVLTVTAKIRDGQARRVFRYSLECAEGSARDYGHFSSEQFAAAMIYPDPPAEALAATPYPTAEADGQKQNMAYGAFASPTLNGLVWLKMSSLAGKNCVDYGFEPDYSPADIRGINLLVHKLMLAVMNFIGQ